MKRGQKRKQDTIINKTVPIDTDITVDKVDRPILKISKMNKYKVGKQKNPIHAGSIVDYNNADPSVFVLDDKRSSPIPVVASNLIASGSGVIESLVSREKAQTKTSILKEANISNLQVLGSNLDEMETEKTQKLHGDDEDSAKMSKSKKTYPKTVFSHYYFEDSLIKAFATDLALVEAVPLPSPEEVLQILSGPTVIPDESARAGAIIEATALAELYSNQREKLIQSLNWCKEVRSKSGATNINFYKSLIGADHMKNEHKLGRKRTAEASFWLFMICVLNKHDADISSVLLTFKQFEDRYAELLAHPKLNMPGSSNILKMRLFMCCNASRILFTLVNPQNNILLALLVTSCAERSGLKYQRSGNGQTFSTSCRRFIVEREGGLLLSLDMQEFLSFLLAEK